MLQQAYLRYNHPDGSSKDWIIEETQNGLLIQWGKTGGTLQSKVIPASQCHPSVRAEMTRRIASKEAKGYRWVSRVKTQEGPLPEPVENAIKEVTDAVKSVVSNTPGIPAKSPAEALVEWTRSNNAPSWF